MDNLGVVRHVGRLLDGRLGSIPFELLKDGDLLLLIDRMLRLRGPDTLRISKVKGHADEDMVLNGQVREVDRLGNNAADEPLTLVGAMLVMRLLMLVVTCLGFVIAGILFSSTFIGFSLLFLELWSLVWSAGALPKRRRLVR